MSAAESVSFVTDEDLDTLEAQDEFEVDDADPEAGPIDAAPDAEAGSAIERFDTEADALARTAEEAAAQMSVVPADEEMRALVQLAVTMSAADLVPKALRGKPNDVLLVMLTARDLGIKLTSALRLCYPIDGKVTIAPKLMLAMVRDRGLGRVWADPGNDMESATWYGQRADDPHELVQSATFSWEDAAMPTGRNRLVDPRCEPRSHAQGCKCKDNWRNYPARMLSWRAMGYLLDDVFSEVATGVYQPDELGAITDEDGQPVIDVTEVGPLDGMAGPRQSGNRAPSPSTPAGDDVKEEITSRLRSLPDDLQAECIGAWTEKVGYKIVDLPANKVATARALLDAYERRVPTDSSEDPQDSPDGASDDADDPDPSDGDATQETAIERFGPVGDVDELISKVQALSMAQVTEYLALAEIEAEGGENDLRRVLAEYLAVELELG